MTGGPRNTGDPSVPTSAHGGDPIRVGISSCLLGEKVRFDGGHKLDQYAVGTLGRYVDWVPVCPELEMGLGVPREALRLVGDPEAPRLVTVRSRVDQTEGMLTWTRDKVEQPGHLVAFHARHKLLLMAHSEPHLRALGRLVARARTESPGELLRQYAEGLFAGLRVKATTRKHTNVLQHIAGYLREPLDRRDRDELHGTIADYHRGLVPLIVPLTLLRHYVGKFALNYLRDQVYLDPHPKELMLLNHV